MSVSLKDLTVANGSENATKFAWAQLLNELSGKVAQVLKLFEFATKYDQPGFYSLTHLEVKTNKTYVNFPYRWNIWMNCVQTYTTSKQIELESHGSSGFEAF